MPTLHALRQNLSGRFGGYEAYVTGVQTSEDGSYAGTASGTSATRRLVSTDLADLDLVGTGSDTSNTHYDGAWVYIPDSRAQRRIVKNGYARNVAANTVITTTSTAAVGHLTLHRPLQVAVPGGTDFEVHRWPVRDDDRKLGLHTAINRALGLLYVRDRLSITGLGTTINRYTLAAYPWLISEAQLVSAQDTEVLSGLDPAPLSGGGVLRIDGDTPYLITGAGVATTATFTIDVMRPRSSWIKLHGSTWGESTMGLQDDDDECTGGLERITSVAEYLICREMANHDPAGETGEYGRRAARLAIAVSPWLIKDFVLVGQQRTTQRRGVLANVPGGLREVSTSGSGWP